MSDPRRDEIIKQARALQGIPYRLEPPPDGVNNLDCSLFVLEAFKAAGVPLASIRTAEQIRQATVPIGWDEVLPGDLLFYTHTYDATEAPGPDGELATHVGISLGAGSHQMIDANEAHGVGVTLLSGWWQDHLLEARRAPALLTTSPGEPVTVPTMPRGVDVASYQGAPDWAAVAASGIAFAFTKATEGTNYLNPTFARNWSEIKAHNMARGAYHFARPDANNPEVEAEYFVGAVMARGIETGDLLALDLEDGSGDLSSWTLRFLQHVKRLVGFDPLVYTSAGFAAAHHLAALPEIGERGLWLAAWQSTLPSAPDPWEFVAFHQYTDSGQVPGINGNVDLDRFNGPVERIKLYGKPAGAVTPPTDPPPSQLITKAEIDAVIATLTDWRERVGA